MASVLLRKGDVLRLYNKVKHSVLLGWKGVFLLHFTRAQLFLLIFPMYCSGCAYLISPQGLVKTTEVVSLTKW